MTSEFSSLSAEMYFDAPYMGPPYTLPSEYDRFAELLADAEKNAERKYGVIGKFVVKFELLIHTLRVDIAALFQSNGLQKGSLVYCLVGHPAVTARPLIGMYTSTVASLHPDPELQRALRWIESEGSALVEARNDIVHGTWHFDPNLVFSDPNKTEKLSGVKYQPNIKGLGQKPLPDTVEQFNKLCERVDHLRCIVNGLVAALIKDGDWKRAIGPDGTKRWKIRE